MKAISKIAALGMVLSLAFVLTACGGSAASSSAASSAASSTTSASAAASSTAASSTAASTSASSASADTFKAGVVNGDTWTNEFFGLKFTLPAGFKFQSSEEMAQMNAAVTDMLNDEAVTQALQSGTAVFDMSAVSEDKKSNINVVVEYAGTPEAQAFTADDYVTYTKSVVGDQLKSAGATVEDIQSGTYENHESGKTYPALKLKMTMNNVPMYQELICVKQGNYFMSITATSTEEAALDSILCNILPL